MGEWKIQISVRVSQVLRIEIENFAAREQRTLSNFVQVLEQRSFAQLKVAGSTERLLTVPVTLHAGKHPQ
jgi:hypothetical protein